MILPKLKEGAQFGIAVPGLAKVYYDALPEDKKAFFDNGAMPAFLTADRWKAVIGTEGGADIRYCAEMECTNDAWSDWMRASSPLHNGGGIETRMDPKTAFIALTGVKKTSGHASQ
jgi:hypothetical protein